jgi:hypothetical protein
MISRLYCNPIVGTGIRGKFAQKARWEAGLEDRQKPSDRAEGVGLLFGQLA